MFGFNCLVDCLKGYGHLVKMSNDIVSSEEPEDVEKRRVIRIFCDLFFEGKISKNGKFLTALEPLISKIHYTINNLDTTLSCEFISEMVSSIMTGLVDGTITMTNDKFYDPNIKE